MAAAGAEAPASPVVAPAAPSAAGAWPDFAVICSFLERYGTALDLPELTFPELEEALEETGAVSKSLVELHLKLLRKIGKSVTIDRWEKYLFKVCQDYNSTWAWELEKKGYQDMSVECKVGMLKHLCECQFDDNLKFKNAINEEDADAMRLQPIGRDKDGLMYWFQLDQDHNIRMYVEEQDDQDGSSWKCIVRTRNDLAETLELLKAQIDPELLKKSEPQESSSRESPNPEDDSIKKENGEGAVENGHVNEKDPDLLDKPACPEEEKSNSFKTAGDEPLKKTEIQIKTEPLSDTEEEKQTAKEEKDSFKENVKPVKEDKLEPKDENELKGSSDKVTPPEESERSEVSVIVKRTEDPVEKTVEETEKIRNDQQAKIPLKKRELKLTDDFDSSVKASLCKSVTPTKELLLKDDGKQEDDHVKTGVTTVPDGKQLVNGEVNSEKTAHKAKVGQGEKNTSKVRETVIGSAKEENCILNEKRNGGVIKSLHEVKESSKAKSTENTEKSGICLQNDIIPSSADKTDEKAPLKEESSDPSLKKTSVETKDGEATKRESMSDSSNEKLLHVKEASKKDVKSAKASKEPSVLGKPGEDSLEKCSETSQEVLRPVTAKSRDPKEKSGAEEQEEDGIRESSEDKPDSTTVKRIVTRRALKSQLPRKVAIAAKNSTLRPEVPAKNREEAEDHEKVVPETGQKEKEKSSETETKTSTSKRNLKDKTVSKETDAKVESDTKLAKDKQPDGTASAEEEKSSKIEKQSSKSRHRYKVDLEEDENSGTEGKEMTSERQKDGIKLTIRISSKRKRGEVPPVQAPVEEVEEAEPEESIGRTLRRSPRISRPTVKAAEVKDRKPEKKQSDDEDKPASQKSDRDDEIKCEKDPGQKIKKTKPRQRRRARWTSFRSRRRRKSSSEEESEESDSEDDSEEGSEDEEKEAGVPGEDDEPCKKCGLPNHPELILLCDSCDSGYHTACLRPPLMLIPDGEWFCPPCQHKLLCEKLEEQLQNLDVVLKKKERAERRKERLVYVGISIENIIPTQEAEEVPVHEKEEKKTKKKTKLLERRSTRTRKCISYRFDEFDEAIEEAIEDDIRDADGGGGGGRGKDMSNIIGHRGKDISTILESERTEGKRPQRTVTRRKKRRRLNDLDSDSNLEEEESEEEFRISDGSQDEFVVSDDNLEESDEDQQSNDSDFGARRPRRHYQRPMRKSRRLKRRTARKRYSDDDEDEDSDEEEQESESEQSSDYSDDYLETRRRRSRRNQKRQVNYKEDSESDNSQKGARYGRGKEMRRVLKRRFSSSESNASDDGRGSDNELPQRGRRHLLRKRIRSSNEESAEEEEEEERPVRKRLNRIETDDEEDGDTAVSKDEKPTTDDKPPVSSTLQESTKKPCYRLESDDDDDFETVGKDGSPLDYSLVDLPSANGQSPGKNIENLIGKPSEKSQTSKDTSANISQASNGTSSSQDVAVPEEDEDELLRVTDLVDYVCNSEQL
ncbi:remodeling and spacing factor 1 [Rhinophrynus dorsalis]